MVERSQVGRWNPGFEWHEVKGTWGTSRVCVSSISRMSSSSSCHIGGQSANLADYPSSSNIELVAPALRAPMKPKSRNVRHITSMCIFHITHGVVKLMPNRRPISEPSGLPESFKHRVGGSGTPSTNDTKIKEREAHHEYVYLLYHAWGCQAHAK